MGEDRLSETLWIDDAGGQIRDDMGEGLILDREIQFEDGPEHNLFAITYDEARALLRSLIKRFPLDAIAGDDA